MASVPRQVPSHAVSAIICAYTEERWDALCAAITSLRQQTYALHEIVVVVDHNPALAARLRRFPGAHMVVENTFAVGLSGARNAGVAASTGDLLLFLDDDARAHPTCLEHLVAPIAHYDNVLGVGGCLLPDWSGSPPTWFPSEFLWVVGCSYRGLPATRSPVRNLIGACMCIPRSVFHAVGGFRADLGRVGPHPAGDEETEFCIRAQHAFPHAHFLYEPQATVSHQVSLQRAQLSYFLTRCYHEGISKALLTRVVGSQHALKSERAYVSRVLPAGVARGGAQLLRGHGSGGLRAAAITAGLAATTFGYARGLLAAAHAGRRPSPRRAQGPRHYAPGAEVHERPDASAASPSAPPRVDRRVYLPQPPVSWTSPEEQ